MSGEALTAGFSATRQFSLEIVEVHYEGINAFAGQGKQEVGAVQTSNSRRFFLRNLCSRVPVDGRGKSQLATELLRRASQRREYVFWKLQSLGGHGSEPTPTGRHLCPKEDVRPVGWQNGDLPKPDWRTARSLRPRRAKRSTLDNVR